MKSLFKLLLSTLALSLSTLATAAPSLLLQARTALMEKDGQSAIDLIIAALQKDPGFADQIARRAGIALFNLWGAQLELGSTANTYIPTTSSAIYNPRYVTGAKGSGQGSVFDGNSMGPSVF